MDEIEFFVPGLPAPGGSKRGFYNAKLNRTLLVEANPEKNRNWRAAVALAASEAMNGRDIFSGPLYVEITFQMPRPKAHFSRKSGLKKSAPHWNTTKPDITKLARSTEDAMTQVVWKDDAQIAQSVTHKLYADNQSGAQIRVSQLIF
jgi:Holliday junction resolvase RusA-like endonuclease